MLACTFALDALGMRNHLAFHCEQLNNPIITLSVPDGTDQFIPILLYGTCRGYNTKLQARCRGYSADHYTLDVIKPTVVIMSERRAIFHCRNPILEGSLLPRNDHEFT